MFVQSVMASLAEGKLSAGVPQGSAQALAQLSSEYFRFLCSRALKGDEATCLERSRKLLGKSLHDLKPNLTVKELRPMILSMTMDRKFRSIIERSFFKNNSDTTIVRQRIWKKFNVLVLEGETYRENIEAVPWTISELQLLEAGYEKLFVAIQTAVGAESVQEFSHLWGAGGSVARIALPLDLRPLSGEFGLVYSDFPLQINVVVNIVKENFSESLLAERLAHENTHSQDFILGSYVVGELIHWTDTAEAQIYEACNANASRDSSFFKCRDLSPKWFSFHPTNYAAKNAAEFYGKMMDEWVRENLGLVPKGRYRCQNSTTFNFWNEFEGSFIGQRISTQCAPAR